MKLADKIAIAAVVLSVVGVLSVSTVVAQQQRASDAVIGGSINEIVSQRDIAQARAVEYAGKLAEALAEIERLKKLCGDACKPEKK